MTKQNRGYVVPGASLITLLCALTLAAGCGEPPEEIEDAEQAAQNGGVVPKTEPCNGVTGPNCPRAPWEPGAPQPPGPSPIGPKPPAPGPMPPLPMPGEPPSLDCHHKCFNEQVVCEGKATDAYETALKSATTDAEKKAAAEKREQANADCGLKYFSCASQCRKR